MTAKQAQGLIAPDGSHYVTLSDGAGNLGSVTVTTSDIEIGAVEIKNATTDDRVTVSAAGAMKVDASSVAVPVTDNSGSITVDYATTGSGTATGALRVELPTNGTGVVGLNAGTAIIGKAGIDQTTAVTTNGVVIAPVASSLAGIAAVPSTTLETGHVIKASAGNLYGLNVTTTTVAGIVQVFNSTTVPAAGAVTPIKAYQIPAASSLMVGFDPPLYCSTGISVAFSIATTPFTKTDSATAFISGDAV